MNPVLYFRTRYHHLKNAFLMIFSIMSTVMNHAEEPVPLVIEKTAPLVMKASREGDRQVIFADFGKDAYGNLEIRFQKHSPEGPVVVRLGEKLDDHGSIDRNPPGSVNYREINLSTDSGTLLYRLTIPRKPRHTDPRAVPIRPEIGEITPFRYAELEFQGADPLGIELSRLEVHAPFDDTLSSFESSDSRLNSVWELCKHTMKASSAFGMFIDGERERIPYEADAYINQLSYAACNPDPRMVRATFDRLMDFPTWPTEWLLHMPMIAWSDYMATDDPAIAIKHFDTLKKRILALKTTEDGLLVAGAIVDWPQSERDGYNGGCADPSRAQQVGPRINTVANAFYCEALGKMARLAAILGKKADAAEFDSRAKSALESFNRVFFDPKTGLYVDGEADPSQPSEAKGNPHHSSLHANMFPLAFGLVPKERIAPVAAFVKSRGMSCSVYGAQYLLEALMATGSDADAISIMTSEGPRSWRHMIASGSTMTWEAWDSSVKPNLTWNHAWGAAPANIISRYVLGIRPLEPGFAKILVAPNPVA